ncbi:uncharacterized protein LOC129585178 [Paramacrobiotus metropolitanus]|uniref:uncharacterized protein LOC129585178 n=1 Tax=Paramacrobiotus metropolitanus TaxID=2943436 RepID=UPI0024462576|nr:uncharacterized protein LOC129585178 [Paramacrobiotus metropolitanus]
MRIAGRNCVRRCWRQQKTTRTRIGCIPMPMMNLRLRSPPRMKMYARRRRRRRWSSVNARWEKDCQAESAGNSASVSRFHGPAVQDNELDDPIDDMEVEEEDADEEEAPLMIRIGKFVSTAFNNPNAEAIGDAPADEQRDISVDYDGADDDEPPPASSSRAKQRKRPPPAKQGKKPRARPGVKALKEIKQQQKMTSLIIRKTPFQRLVREISQEIKEDFRWNAAAIYALQQSGEHFLIDMFEKCMKAALHANRVTIDKRDRALVSFLTDQFKLPPAEPPAARPPPRARENPPPSAARPAPRSRKTAQPPSAPQPSAVPADSAPAPEQQPSVSAPAAAPSVDATAATASTSRENEPREDHGSSRLNQPRCSPRRSHPTEK